MAAIPASLTTSSRTSSRRRSNPTRTVTAIHPSHLSPTAGMLLSKVTMYVLISLASNIHEIDMYQSFPGSAVWVQSASGLWATNARKTRSVYHFPTNHIFRSES